LENISENSLKMKINHAHWRKCNWMIKSLRKEKIVEKIKNYLFKEWTEEVYKYKKIL
jgi:hypothetical protein